MMSARRIRGLAAVGVIAAGQLVSLTGSELSAFALGIWVYQRTHSVMQFALIVICESLPQIFVSPLAGLLVDRWNRKTVLVLADAVGVLACLLLGAVALFGSIAPWHVGAMVLVTSACRAFQVPALSAVTTLLVGKEQLGRASGMLQLGQAASQMMAPILGGALSAVVPLSAIIGIDLCTFALSIATILVVHVRLAPPSVEGQYLKGTFRGETLATWRFLKVRSGLLALLGVIALTNIVSATAEILLTPLILRLAGPQTLGLILALAGVGMLCGAGLMSVWGGPRKKISGVLGFCALFGLSLILGGTRPSLGLMATAAFAAMFWIPLVSGCSQALWQAKVPPDLQGRVFAFRQMISRGLTPLALLLAGPLADRVFEPRMLEGGALARSAGALIGVGPGRGVALLFMAMGIIPILASAAATAYPPLRSLDELPDAAAEPSDAAG